eukprot:3932237-Rhodomonas_salina.2
MLLNRVLISVSGKHAMRGTARARLHVCGPELGADVTQPRKCSVQRRVCVEAKFGTDRSGVNAGRSARCRPSGRRSSRTTLAKRGPQTRRAQTQAKVPAHPRACTSMLRRATIEREWTQLPWEGVRCAAAAACAASSTRA